MHHGDVSPEIAAGLLALKKRIDAAKIPSSKLDETINVAIWNIREFGKVHRTEAAVHFIAEILGQFDFIAIATHARWGDSIAGRQAELQMLADWIDTRFKNQFVEDHDLIVMGDFNVPKIGDSLFKALTSRGLMVPDALQDLKAGDQ